MDEKVRGKNSLPVNIFTHWWQMVEVFVLPRILAKNAKGKTVLQELTDEGDAVQDLKVRPKHLRENTSLLKLRLLCISKDIPNTSKLYTKVLL